MNKAIFPANPRSSANWEKNMKKKPLASVAVSASPWPWDRLSHGLCLASASPRRLELLRQVGIEPVVRPVAIDESRRTGEPVAVYATRLARAKATQAMIEADDQALQWFLGADTVVTRGKHVFGKPQHAGEAIAMLQRLSGRWHRVVTAIALRRRQGKEHVRVVVSRVRCKRLSRQEIQAYVGTGEPLDKAGAYAIQGLGAFMVKRLRGSYSNVVGLPLCQTLALLAKLASRPGGVPP